MAGSFCTFWMTEILDHVFGKGSYTAPTIYIGLSKADPGVTGSGISEPSIGVYNYARKQTAAGDWNSSSGGVIDNANGFTFNQCQTGAWGTITHFFATDDPTFTTNILFYGALSSSNTIEVGDTPSFAAGELVISINGGADSFCNYLEDKVMDHLFGKASYTPPTIYIGLSTADPTEDGSGTSEPAGGDGYSRVVTAGATWDAATAGIGVIAVDNASAITFPQCVNNPWGHITHFFGIDNSAGGNFLFYGELTAHKDVDVSDYFSFTDGNLDIQISTA